jgi:hypothetical protein
MANAKDVIELSVRRLSDAIDTDDRPAVITEVEVLVDIAVPLIATSDTVPFRIALPALRTLLATTIAGKGEEDRDDGITGRLATLVTLFTIAASRPDRSSVIEFATQGAPARILEVAAAHDGALTNQQLAVATGYAEETIARIMPILRRAGLFEVERNWKRKLNRITEVGRSLVRPGSATAN